MKPVDVFEESEGLLRSPSSVKDGFLRYSEYFSLPLQFRCRSLGSSPDIAPEFGTPHHFQDHHDGLRSLWGSRSESMNQA